MTLKELRGTSLNQHCNYCGEKVVGRAGKRFCDDACRSSFNNQLNRVTKNYRMAINYALGKNRRILQSMLVDERNSVKVSKDNLIAKGYDFKYLTHINTTKSGSSYTYCYDYGYLPLENEMYLIVKDKRG